MNWDDHIHQANDLIATDLEEDLDALARQLQRRGIDVETVIEKLQSFELAVPTWGVGTGGTRFARFPGPAEPRHLQDKLEDCGVIHRLTQICPRVSPHFPWDDVSDPADVKDKATALGLTFDAVNSNTFQDQLDQVHSYKFGSLTHTDKAVRAQAIAHNIDCISKGVALGSKALTVWIADGANMPGQQDITGALERYLDSMTEIYVAVPDDWQLFIEHKFFEPAFYATVIADWGTSVLCAQTLGPKAQCLVDLGHHAPNTNIEMIVSRLHQFGKLGGFHFNDSKYGDDDLDSGSIHPFQLFLVFNELVIAERRTERQAKEGSFNPAYMMDQSHNVTDPIESLMMSADSIARAYANALIVERDLLEGQQAENDALGAAHTLRRAFRTDVGALVAEARRRRGGAIDPLSAYRSMGYRDKLASTRPTLKNTGSGIV